VVPRLLDNIRDIDLEIDQCPVNLAPGITCSTRKKGADKRCTMRKHFLSTLKDMSNIG